MKVGLFNFSFLHTICTIFYMETNENYCSTDRPNATQGQIARNLETENLLKKRRNTIVSFTAQRNKICFFSKFLTVSLPVQEHFLPISVSMISIQFALFPAKTSSEDRLFGLWHRKIWFLPFQCNLSNPYISEYLLSISSGILHWGVLMNMLKITRLHHLLVYHVFYPVSNSKEASTFYGLFYRFFLPKYQRIFQNSEHQFCTDFLHESSYQNISFIISLIQNT